MRALLCRIVPALALLALAATATGVAAQGSPTMTLLVDETQAPRRIAFVHEEIHVKPGTVALAYPKWIPGEHGPTGPITSFAGLRVHGGSATLPWVRDPEDIYTIKVEVPQGADTITVDFDILGENTLSNHQLLLAWNSVVLYPLGVDKRELMIEPSLILPPRWKQGSSLQVTGESGDRVNFGPTSLERLIDSPVLAGEFFRAVPLASQWPAELEFTGDSQAAIDKADDAHAFSLFGKLVDEDRAMFGFRHWQKLHLLVSQSAARDFDGLEHEDSPWNSISDAGLSKKDELERTGLVNLAHEQSHSWDGKYRRPEELYSKTDYQGPERTSLLWVYEGLNEYIGFVLATRAGFNDADYLRNQLGWSASDFAHEAGRAETPLVDTATENWVLRSANGPWSSLRRRQDYYDEGALMWLYADVLIRQQSHGSKSLDDFLKSFLGQRDTDPIVVPYTRADVEASLNAALPYDWHNFIEKYVYKMNDQAPTDGLEAAGWRLVYNSTPVGPLWFSNLEGPPEVFEDDSIGIELQKGGKIFDVLPGSAAYAAGLGPQMTILAVDGRVYSPDVLKDSIASPHNGKISIVARNFDSVTTYEVSYPGGLRYPHIERIPGSHDYLSDILAPRSNGAH
jgi:predicted metalloprotease with PDZ domain